MGRPRIDKPLLTIRGTRGYFNAGALMKCKIDGDTYFEVTKTRKEKGYFIIRFNRTKKGFRCGKPSSVRQSQTGMKKVLNKAGFESYEGKFIMKRIKKKPRTWKIVMDNAKEITNGKKKN